MTDNVLFFWIAAAGVRELFNLAAFSRPVVNMYYSHRNDILEAMPAHVHIRVEFT